MCSGLKIMLVLFVFSAFSSKCSAGNDKSTAASESKASNFYQSICDYYKAPQKEVQAARKLPDEEIPVAYFFARTAKVSLEDIINQRLTGSRWSDISKYYEIPLNTFANPLTEENSCRRHEFPSKLHKAKKLSIKKISDKEIVNRINIKFISEDHLCSPSYVKSLRKQGDDFVSINDKITLEHKELLQELRTRNRSMESLAEIPASE
ncbi:MAG: hypothetical protein ACM34K_07055 [Bacillota bacterium]